jgi:hypothetical protein
MWQWASQKKNFNLGFMIWCWKKLKISSIRHCIIPLKQIQYKHYFYIVSIWHPIITLKGLLCVYLGNMGEHTMCSICPSKSSLTKFHHLSLQLAFTPWLLNCFNWYRQCCLHSQCTLNAFKKPTTTPNTKSLGCEMRWWQRRFGWWMLIVTSCVPLNVFSPYWHVQSPSQWPNCIHF